MWNRIKTKAGLLSLLALLLVACTDDEVMPEKTKENALKVKIAVILPESGGNSAWDRVLEWAHQNILQANDIVEPEYEFYDENSIDVESVATDLASREDIVAVIGCYHSINTEILARKCALTYKPVFTFSTSNELPRAFGQRGFLWCLAESDITQCELLLIKAERYGAKKVSLLASDDIYGQTFTDWFAFQAVELGMEVASMESYQSDNLSEKFSKVTSSPADCLICAPSSVEDACQIVDCYQQSGYAGRLLFSDVAYDAKLIEKLGTRSNGIEGIALSPDPTTGFSISYMVNFGENPGLGEAQVYDAVMIACYAYRYSMLHEMDMNEAISSILNQRSYETGLWTSAAIANIFRKIEQGQTPAFSGASGNLDFSTENYTSVLYSTYAHWMAYEGKFIHLDYDNRSESGTSSMYAAWEWNKQYYQQFDENADPGMVYPEQKGNWAVVVAASQGWVNYRHQADALAFYQMLKRNGYDDDHILFIMEDDIAYNQNNPKPGVVRRTVNGENLYEGVKIDYHLSDLTPEKMMKLLQGEGEPSLQSGSGDNVLFFWSGHGEEGEWLWGNNNAISADMVSATFRKMADEGRFRKLLCFVETCYSGSIAKKCEGIPGLLLFTAANDKETSKADSFNNDLGVWMTNRFTSVLLEKTGLNPNISLRELYLDMFHQTLGSHVSVYNSECYGNIYRNTMGEFLLPL